MFGLKRKIAEEVVESIYPSKEWVEAHPAPTYTSDAWFLEDKAHQHLFVCDQMMSMHRMNTILDGHSSFIGNAFTADNNYILWKKKLGLGSFPIPLKESKPVFNLAGMPLTGRIKGELYKVKSHWYLELDNFKTNGLEFRRKRVSILVPYRHQYGKSGATSQEMIQEVQAWMYVGRRTYWDDFIDNGYSFTRCSLFEPNNPYLERVLLGNYYTFTPKEFSD